MQERRNSIANALELRLSCTNPSKWSYDCFIFYNGSSNIGKVTYYSYWNGPQSSWRVIGLSSTHALVSGSGPVHCSTIVYVVLSNTSFVHVHNVYIGLLVLYTLQWWWFLIKLKKCKNLIKVFWEFVLCSCIDHAKWLPWYYFSVFFKYSSLRFIKNLVFCTASHCICTLSLHTM